MFGEDEPKPKHQEPEKNQEPSTTILDSAFYLLSTRFDPNTEILKLETFQSTAGILAIVMPVFNEQRWLDAVFKRVLARSEVGQLVAVDDGSTDRSWEVLQRLAETDPRVQVVQHQNNQGKGAAIRTALKHVTSPLVLIQDADLEYDPTDYAQMLKPILNDEAEVVFGSRFSGDVPRIVKTEW